MNYGSKISGLLLIVVLVLATGTWAEDDPASASLPARGENPAGCRAHGSDSLPHSPSDSPQPAPMNSRCCLTGHDAAAVQASVFPHPSSQTARVAPQIEPVPTESFSHRLDISLVLYADPPGTIPLRI